MSADPNRQTTPPKLSKAQVSILNALCQGAMITRESGPPYRWYQMHQQGFISRLNSRSVDALLDARLVRLEQISERWRSHRLIACQMEVCSDR